MSAHNASPFLSVYLSCCGWSDRSWVCVFVGRNRCLSVNVLIFRWFSLIVGRCRCLCFSDVHGRVFLCCEFHTQMNKVEDEYWEIYNTYMRVCTCEEGFRKLPVNTIHHLGSGCSMIISPLFLFDKRRKFCGKCYPLYCITNLIRDCQLSLINT